MDYQSGDYPSYPGSDKKALHADFEALVAAAATINVTVTFITGGSYFSPGLKRINIDTKTRTARRFVSLGQLSDEYLHAWNQVRGRGTFLDAEAASRHRSFGKTAAAYGTRALGPSWNVAFHKLEALNFVCSGQHIPGFVWRIPYADIREFAYSWAQQA